MADITRRFAGVRRVYGEQKNAHVFIVGVGGVGSWVAEALARTHIGVITLIDMDIIAESNINRQLPALTQTLGDSKIEVMAQRIDGINPNCQVHLVDEFLTKDNVQRLLPSRETAKLWHKAGTVAIVLDCTDDIDAKLAIALHCRFNKLKLIVSGGAGGKIDPTAITVSDLRRCYQDPLLAKLRSNLRELGINANLKENFAIKCVYSTEPPNRNKGSGNKLACGGYGSAVVMTCAMAMTMVAECLKWLKAER